MNRITSGIEALDKILNGGFPSPFVIVVAGEPGTGKTTFVTQLLFKNAEKRVSGSDMMNKTIGLYMTPVAEPVRQVQHLMSNFGFFDKKLVEKKQVVFCDLQSPIRRQPSFFYHVMRDEINKYKPEIAVIDPVSFIEIATDNNKTYRELIYDLSTYAKSQNTNLIITAEISRNHVMDDMLSYLADGIVILSYQHTSYTKGKTLEILKMRGTPYTEGLHRVNITKKGFSIEPSTI